MQKKYTEELITKLSINFYVEMIDKEECICCRINDYYDLEIAEVGSKSLTFQVYVWGLIPGKHIVEQVFDINGVNALKANAYELIHKYINLDSAQQ